jgi:hypothetical protein
VKENLRASRTLRKCFRGNVEGRSPDSKERKIMNIDENDDLNILNDLRATNDHELEILEKLDEICIGTLSDMIIRSLQKAIK